MVEMLDSQGLRGGKKWWYIKSSDGGRRKLKIENKRGGKGRKEAANPLSCVERTYHIYSL